MSPSRLSIKPYLRLSGQDIFRSASFPKHSVRASRPCSNAQKREVLGKLMRQYLKALENTGAFPALPDETEPPAPQPQAKEWVLFYLAQHHDKLGETGETPAQAGVHSILP